jgi:hypothetical protein
MYRESTDIGYTTKPKLLVVQIRQAMLYKHCTNRSIPAAKSWEPECWFDQITENNVEMGPWTGFPDQLPTADAFIFTKKGRFPSSKFDLDLFITIIVVLKVFAFVGFAISSQHLTLHCPPHHHHHPPPPRRHHLRHHPHRCRRRRCHR